MRADSVGYSSAPAPRPAPPPARHPLSRLPEEDRVRASEPQADAAEARRRDVAEAARERLAVDRPDLAPALAARSDRGSGDEAAADAAKTASAGAVAYRGAMYGEVGVGPYTRSLAPEQRFGRYARNSPMLNPRFSSYGIDEFSRPDFRGRMAQQTMVSSQAAFDYALANATNPRGVRFEVPSPVNAARTYDVQLGPNAPFTEIKAGQSINPSQLRADVRAANQGLRIDYRFAGNPLTGHHGPTAAVNTQLGNAATATGGRITSGTTSVSPPAATIRGVETASRVSSGARVFGRVAAPVAVAADAYSIGNAVQADGGRFGRNATVATASAAGGWAGVQAGTAIGALGGPAGAAVGTVVGGVAGSVVGGLFGSKAGEKGAEAVTG